MKPLHGLPIEAFPGPIFIVTAEVEKRQDGVVDPLRVMRHNDPHASEQTPHRA
jgi:hypothetical protein